MGKIKQLKGFSIIELSVSLVVIGLIILAVMTTLQAVGDNTAANKTEIRLEKASESIINNLESGGVSTGTVVKDYSKELWLPTVNSARVFLLETDGYGNNFEYIPARNLLAATVSAQSSPICGNQGTGLQLKLIEKQGPNVTEKIIKDVAFMLISNGSNFKQDFTKSMASSSNDDLITIDRTNKSDDTFRYVTINELKYSLGCIPAVADRFKITTEILPAMGRTTSPDVWRQGANMIATSNPMSTATYSWCIQAASNVERQKLLDNLIFSSNIAEAWFPTDRRPIPNNSLLQTDCNNPANYSHNILEVRVSLNNQMEGFNPAVHKYSTPGTYRFTVWVKSGVDYETTRKTFVQTVVK